MNDINNQPQRNKKPIKPLVIGLSTAVFLIGLASYGFIAYKTPLWPFTATTVQYDKSNNTQIKKSVSTTLRNDTQVSNIGGEEILRIVPVVETTEKGDCNLTVSNGEDSYEFSNSTRDIEGLYGCLEWNINVGRYTPGKYDIKVEFIGKSSKSLLTDTITIK